jgi:hypothetical protein
MGHLIESTFTSTRDAVRFAFALDAYRIGSEAAAVRLALADARVKPHLPLPNDGNTELRGHATSILRALRGAGMMDERHALIAAFSRDVDERGRSITALHPLFCTLLRHLIDNRALVRKLLDRHYTPIRERGHAWELHALANEFKCGHERTRRAATALDDCARKLERLALEALEEQLRPVQQPPAVQIAEVCHA